MKKLVTLILALAFGFGLKAQCPLTQAVDFTATDVHGTEVHLFDILDGGQAVLIDFFFTTCGPCQQATPKIVESYYAMGCNMHDVFYMEIATGDSEQACLNWVNTYGVEYPTISGEAGGTQICNQYSIGAYPTVILIMPDRSIVINDLWPINNAQTVIAALEQHGLEQHDCNTPSYDPQVSITIDQIQGTEVTATFTPNEDCVAYGYMMATEAEIQEWMGIAGLDLPEYLWTYGIPGSGEMSNTFTDLTPNTEYVIYAVPADIDGNLGEVVQVPVTTTPSGPTYDIIPDFTGTDIDGNEIHLYEILDNGQYVLIHFFLVDDTYDFMPYMTESYHFFGCNTGDVFYMEMTPNGYDDAARAWAERYGVEYPTISRTGGANQFVQDIPIGWYPTVMLINPNHEIVLPDIYPITETQTVIDALMGEGIEQHPCYDETLTFSMDTVNLNWGELTWITVYNNTEVDAIVTNTCDEMWWLNFTLDGHEMFDCNFPLEFTIPQGESVELGIECSIVGKSIVPDVVTLWSNLPRAQFVVMVDDTWSVNENEASISLFPNPANDFVTLKGEDLGTVRVYNTLGQKMDEFEANGSELRINTTGYNNGIYFVKTDNQMMKFVVRH